MNLPLLTSSRWSRSCSHVFLHTSWCTSTLQHPNNINTSVHSRPQGRLFIFGVISPRIWLIKTCVSTATVSSWAEAPPAKRNRRFWTRQWYWSKRITTCWSLYNTSGTYLIIMQGSFGASITLERFLVIKSNWVVSYGWRTSWTYSDWQRLRKGAQDLGRQITKITEKPFVLLWKPKPNLNKRINQKPLRIPKTKTWKFWMCKPKNRSQKWPKQ